MNTDETTVVTPVEETTEKTDQTKEVEETAETTSDPLDAISDPEELRKAAKAQRAIAQRYKKAPKEITKPNASASSSSREMKPSDILRADEFQLYREGYTNDEIDLIMSNGGREILKNDKSPLVLGLKVAREQRQAEDAAARATDTSGTSELERKYTKADLEKMKPEELEKVIGFAS